MKKEHQIGIRVGLPAFFALELEDVYRHTSGAHRALAFPDFCGLLIGLGLEQYRRNNTVAPNAPEKARDGQEWEAGEFDDEPEPPEAKRGLRLVHTGERS